MQYAVHILNRTPTDPRKNSLLQRSKRVIIVGHIKNIETLTEAQKAHVRSATDVAVQAGYLKGADAPAATAAKVDRAETNSPTRKKSRKRWTRAAHGTKGASKRAEAAACQEKAAASREVVKSAFERNPVRTTKGPLKAQTGKLSVELSAALEAHYCRLHAVRERHVFLLKTRRRRPRRGRHVCRRSPSDRNERGGGRAVIRKPRFVVDHGHGGVSKSLSTRVTHDRQCGIHARSRGGHQRPPRDNRAYRSQLEVDADRRQLLRARGGLRKASLGRQARDQDRQCASSSRWSARCSGWRVSRTPT
uniref:Uncharacterized protein n=1 Tax=Peronospora matthiolae TaxID=2874970 RepID=A0AAV1VLY9_9STRA